MSEKIKAYKGFDKDLKCRGFSFEVGKQFVHDGQVKACESGFHSCEYPLDVFNYYPPAGSRFAEVEAEGELSKHGDDSKVASSHLTIKAEITLSDLINAAIEYTFKNAKRVKGSTTKACGKAASATGDRGAASATGYLGAASATGYLGAASATGKNSVAMSVGYEGRAMAAEGCAIFLVYRNKNYEIIHAKAAIAGKDVKADTFYILNENGEFVEVV
jgi:hypothetical protein